METKDERGDKAELDDHDIVLKERGAVWAASTIKEKRERVTETRRLFEAFE